MSDLLKSKHNWFSDLLFLSFILSIFYFLWLGSYPLFTPDEGRYSEVAREMVASNDYITPRVNGVVFLDKPIFYYWLQAIAILLFGVKEWALRLFPVLSAILGCLVTYTCGRALFNRRTGWLAAIILATSPLYFGHAHYANLDLEVAVFISCSLLFFITALQTQAKSRSNFLYGAYIFAALAFLTKGLIAVVFPAIILSIWMLLTKRLQLLIKMHLVRGCLLFLLLVFPWYYLVQKANPNFFHYFFITQHITRFLSTNSFNNPTPIWFYIPIILIGFFPWTIFLFQGLKQALNDIRQKNLAHTELFLLIWVAFIFLFFSIPRSKMIGYILPIFPALSLLTGHYLSTTWQTSEKHRGSILLFVGMSLVLAFLMLLIPYYQWIELSEHFAFYLIMILSILISSVIIVLLLSQKKTILPLFMTCAISSGLFLLTLVAGARHLNHNSTKPLIVDLKTIIHPQDEVISYFKFYQDIPLYLGQRITIVADWEDSNIPNRDNWVRELWYGRSFQKNDGLLINEDEFWKRWHADKRVFVFLNENYFSQFKSHINSYFYLGKNNDIILLSNKPTILAKKS